MIKNKDDIKKQLIDDLKKYLIKADYKIPKSISKTFNSKNGLRDQYTYKKYLGGGLSNWLTLAGMNLSQSQKEEMNTRGRRKELSKNEVIYRIWKMDDALDRYIMYDDFRNNKWGVSIDDIKKYWGSVNKMKEALYLEVNQTSMVEKALSKEEFDELMLNIADYIKIDLKKDFTTEYELDSINSIPNMVNSCTLRKYCLKYYDISLPEKFLEYGIKTGTAGRGMKFYFSDGEITTSQFEYLFSMYLRKMGFKYDVDYFRNIDYRSFIKNYKGNKNCDYVIKHKNRVIYIEIAGVIKDYKMCYYSQTPINSKSKEQYRLDLLLKEDMLKENNLEYYILFPCDLTINNIYKILNSNNVELTRSEIQDFFFSNIKWEKIRTIGELKYLSTSNKIQIDYKEY